MKIKLCRISNLFRADFQRTCAILCGMFFAFPLIILLLAFGLHPLFLGLLLVFNLAWFFTLLLGFPGRIQFSDGVLSYTEYYEISRGDRKKISFTVSNVRDVVFHQNKLEKKLNIGRITFRGDAELEPSYHLPHRQTMNLQLCGISNFDSFRQKLEHQA